MKTISLQGHAMPVLGFGTWQLTGREAAQSVDFALRSGYRHIDTAQIYANEAEVGEGIAASGVAREDIFLTTKIWQDNFESAEKAARSVDDSLRKLKTDYVDLLLVHWPFPDYEIADLIDAVMAAQESGKAKRVGVSNFTSAQVEEAQKISGGKIVCNQVEYHPFLSQKPLIDTLKAQNVALTAYSPVARGKAVKDATLIKIGEKYGKNGGQIALRWLVQQDNVAAIPKSKTPENIKANLAIFDFELTPDEMRQIHALARPDGRQVDPGFAPEWDKAA